MVENGDDLVVIEYHINDVFETISAMGKQNYYWVTALPTSFMDGSIDCSSGQFAQYYEQRINTLSDFSIDVDGANSQLTDYMIQVSVEKVAFNSAQNLRLMVALTETDIPYYWMGEEFVNYCERFMLPDHNGTLLNFSSGDLLDFTYSFSIDPEWVNENSELVVWIQDLSTKEVHQTIKRSLSVFGGLPANDVRVNDVYTPATLCSDVIEPGIEVMNLGSEELTTLDFVYQIDNEPEQTYSWTGSIPPNDSAMIDLPELETIVVNSAIFSVEVENPNGQSDEFPYDNSMSSEILQAQNVTSPVTLVLKLDDFPEQTTWGVYSSDGSVLYSGGDYTEPGVFVIETLELDGSDCFSFVINDDNGDGLGGNGMFKLMHGTIVFHQGKDFGYMEEVQLTIGLTHTVDMGSESLIRFYPNPAKDVLHFEGQTAVDLNVIDPMGQLIRNVKLGIGPQTIDISNLPSGIYFMEASTNDRKITTYKLVIQ